ncbi:unnamed protein product [Calypogeia fissa]
MVEEEAEHEFEAASLALVAVRGPTLLRRGTLFGLWTRLMFRDHHDKRFLLGLDICSRAKSFLATIVE